ncbi:right-handed parallel beta-helix repeat-containing protein [Bradyrhizobium genosp. P]|uniref:right-handed parallel beta-helix repeat-containing protein n=1 Tax=Bradyrhizobium genosp. P TaxID=83641 RepID=UPI003CE8E432
MKTRVGILAILLAFGLVFPFLAIAPAQAQATRTWISGVGDDANPCSRTAPCKTFAGAISKTAAAGEINVLDPGGFGGVTITKSITLRADHVEGGVLVAGTNGITVAAGATDSVTIDGLDIEGLGSGIHGVSVTSGLKVYVVRCRIHGFTQNGINMASSTSSGNIFVTNSYIYNNAGGINLSGTSNLANVNNTQIYSNSSFSVQTNGAGNVVGLQNSALLDSPASLITLNGGTAISIGPSNLFTGTGAFNTTIPYK